MTDTTSIRERAIVLYEGKAHNVREMSSRDIEDLVWELGVHQIELELQNEELRRARAQLAESRDMYAELYDFAPVGYLTLGPDGLIDRANLTLSRMLGIARSELMHQHFSAFVASGHVDDWCRSFVRLKDNAKGPSDTCQLRMRRADGHTFWAQLSAHAVYDPPGHLHTVRLTLADITELKTAQQDQYELSSTLQEKNRQLESLLYTTSHDLRSPLVTISGFAEELLRGCRRVEDLVAAQSIPDGTRSTLHTVIDSDLIESARFIKVAAAKMDSLLKGLLEISRIGSEPGEITTVDMNTVVDEILAACQFDIRQKRAQVTRDDLPPCLGERSRTPRVFANLIQNALKFLDPRRRGRIHISGCVDEGQCTYCVTDNGIGIQPEDQPRIFDMFYHVASEGVINGEGLGLTIAARILERQNGKIWLDSTPGKGTTFFVMLPSS